MNIPDYDDIDDSTGRGCSRFPQGVCLVLMIAILAFVAWLRWS